MSCLGSKTTENSSGPVVGIPVTINILGFTGVGFRCIVGPFRCVLWDLAYRAEICRGSCASNNNPAVLQ